MGATKTSSAPLFSPFVNKEHLCGHSVDKLGTRSLRKCLFTITLLMLMMMLNTDDDRESSHYDVRGV